MLKQLIPIPKILGGIGMAFLAILGVRVTYPMANMVLGLFKDGIMKVVAILVMWLVYVFVLYVFVWLRFFEKDNVEGGMVQNG